MRISRLLPALAAAVVLAGCGGSDAPGPGPVFDNEGGSPLTCMRHQPAPPGARYTDPARRDTAEVLTMLRYYTANGHKPYCDGQPPTPVDTAWARLFVDLGAASDAVAPLLPAR